jgi:hypothetical protein
MSSLTAHGNQTAFPFPDTVQLSRWMTTAASTASTSSAIDTESRGGTDSMRKLYMPFGKGRHKCAGASAGDAGHADHRGDVGAPVRGAVGGGRDDGGYGVGRSLFDHVETGVLFGLWGRLGGGLVVQSSKITP